MPTFKASTPVIVHSTTGKAIEISDEYETEDKAEIAALRESTSVTEVKPSRRQAKGKSS